MDVVFLHGWLMGPYVWDHQVAALDGIANTHAFAAPAHGTPAPPEEFTMADWANLVIGELDRHSVGQAIFVGHSMGSYLTQQIWRDHPERVLGFGLVAASERPGTLDEQQQFVRLMVRSGHDWRALVPTVADLLVGSNFRAEDPSWIDRWTDQVERDYDLSGMTRLIAAINGRPDYAPTTSKIDVPATLIHGTDDNVFTLDFGHHLASLITGADLVVLEGAGHAPSMEQPGPVSTAVRDLVDKVIHQTSE